MPELRASGKREGLHYNGFWNSVVDAIGLIGDFDLEIAGKGLELRKSG